MKPEPNGQAEVLKALASIQAELAKLGARVAALETAGLAEPSRRSPTATAAPPKGSESLSEEVVLILGAAVAAFLGKKAHIRGIQLLGSAAWAQQGRVAIQASHALNSSRNQP